MACIGSGSGPGVRRTGSPTRPPRSTLTRVACESTSPGSTSCCWPPRWSRATSSRRSRRNPCATSIRSWATRCWRLRTGSTRYLAKTKKGVIQAVREGRAHPYLTTFRLCQEFGWTPAEVGAQRAADIETFVLILDELERQSALAPADDDATTILITGD